MKILLIGEIHHPEELARAIAATPPGEPSPLFPPSQGPYFWIRALRKLGHEVTAFLRDTPALFGRQARKSGRFTGAKTLTALFQVLSSRAPHLHPDYGARNRRLIKQVADERPDVLLMNGGNKVIFPETLAELKARFGVKLVYTSGVSPIVFSHAIERKAAPLYDLVTVNDFYHGVQWLELGAKRMEALPMSACDPDFHRPYALTEQEQAEYGCAVGFVGTLLPPNLYSTRVAALEQLTDLGLGIWSIHALPDSLKGCYRGAALGAKMLRILCGSQIQVNPHGNFMRYGGNMRLFEAAACGVFQIADDLPGNRMWFTPDESIAFYRDPQHLRAQVQHYLRHDAERQQIAAAAQRHVYAKHTYLHRMQSLVELIAQI